MARDYNCRSENDHYSIYGTKKCSLPLSLALKYVHTGGIAQVIDKSLKCFNIHTRSLEE